VRIAVYDVTGRLVKQLVDGRTLPAGEHPIPWDGLDDSGARVRGGVYIVHVRAGNEVATGKLIRL
jgi:hypothetical protein